MIVSASLIGIAQADDLPIYNAVRGIAVIDGVVSSNEWSNASMITGLLPAVDASSNTLSQTIVRAMWDEQYLYIAFDCTDPEVYCTHSLRHDDNLYTEDVCEVFIDGFGDGLQFVELQVSPAGEYLDLMYLFSAPLAFNKLGTIDGSFSARHRWKWLEYEMQGLQCAAQITSSGWSVELAIPATDIVKRKGQSEFRNGDALRIQFVRYDHIPDSDTNTRKLTQQTWVSVPVGNPHNCPHRFGRIHLTDSL